jgi:hypothetical protein
LRDYALGLAFFVMVFAPAIVAAYHWRKSNGDEF